LIEFEPEIKNPRLLRKAVRWAERNGNPIPSLSDLARRSSFDELMSIAQSWNKAGLGDTIEASHDGELSIHFVLGDAAKAKAKELDQRSLIGRARAIPIGQGVWKAIELASAAIVGALATKYFG
jgi:hypothetical protein